MFYKKLIAICSLSPALAYISLEAESTQATVSFDGLIVNGVIDL